MLEREEEFSGGRERGLGEKRKRKKRANGWVPVLPQT
jgi:hypothetical protein